MAAEGRDVPFWVDEGIASFIELLKPAREGRLDIVRFERGKRRQGGFEWIGHADEYLDAFARLQKAGVSLDLELLLRGKLEGMKVEAAYGLSWVLVHYLVNGEGGALRRPFQDWLTGAMGSPEDPGVAAAIGRTRDQITAALVAHVTAMKRSG